MYTKKDQKIYNKTKKFLENINDTEIEEKMKKIDSVLKISDTKERYSYLFELICDYLDNEFRKNNLCDFDNCGLCKRRRALKEKNPNKETYLYGCCYSYINKRVCPFLNKDGSCTNRNIGCKLFTCHYLKKEGYSFNLNDIYLSKYFFTKKEKKYLDEHIYLTKEVVMDHLMKHKK